MAEMDTSGGGGHKKGPGVKKGKKLSTRVDLTPMVDLGFLLITFFIFTTTMSQPTAMRLFLPKDADKPEDQNKAKESGVITLLLGKDNNVFYYEGQLESNGSNFKSSNFKEIRTILIDKKRNTPEKDLVVIIKPSADCTYKNVVDVLDEMAINVLKKYALVDISEGEAALVKISDASGSAGAGASN
ncbi:MAG: biopolymer transporter ExbD [Sphingobacteriia bacterium 24-36-13]|jgi:biopolymer transport protein ExbD|uniref:ExbD/TolR family protein n=1 Tax=Sediminibacterium sp. TaxID=1917865 RepID=UPI000BDBA2F3|nr:biopolymer transporter ExbD [Sediminibacterium sp.]OYY10551.1 MAG: biopolymer transporter ExbD [Sphingobacteriia bacterium 35-36-14]OYZ54235.1 MAG: biopolymer transporter ExbD [Sphingobacteriia bacterium 24-36-13]OZA65658.1 MAG: biopolymer transporter ExbD [Sphingobacteriia bacterium 39-36-14]HQS23735.1 biopolymer transporter ExbD [Sediminibacterium sp.]HQS34126.1 biopolymer transporter ExbD [Sediminibacterium sp.]